ncbi:MAG: hypothetical protein ACFFG0_41270 [Candidatus Thorarchaeota archaeon]
MAKKIKEITRLTDKKIIYYINDEMKAYEEYMNIYYLDPNKYGHFRIMALQEKEHEKYLRSLLAKRKENRKKKRK